MRALSVLGILLGVLGASRVQAAAGIERVELRFEGGLSAAAIALAESDLRTAFGRRGVEVAGRQGSASTALLTIVATNERMDALTLALESPGVPAIARRLDLTSFPADERMLALVVAADEMLAAVTDPHRARENAARTDVETTPAAASARPGEHGALAALEATGPARVATVGERANEREATSPAPPRAPAVAALSASFAFERFAGGQTHLGADLTFRRRVAGRAYASLGAEGRKARTVASDVGTIDARLLGARLAGGFALVDGGGPLELDVELGVRGDWLRFEGQPAPAVDVNARGRDAGGLLAYADARLALGLWFGRLPLGLRLAVGAGAPIVAQAAARGSTTITAASGAAFESSAGLIFGF